MPTQEERGASAREAWEASTPPPLPAPVVPNGYFVLEPMSSSVALKASYRGGGCLGALLPHRGIWNGTDESAGSEELVPGSAHVHHFFFGSSSSRPQPPRPVSGLRRNY